MSDVVIESRERVKSLLKELFRSDMHDLDFSIYRILNHKRDQIEKFIETDLIQAAQEEFEEFGKAGIDGLKAEVADLKHEINQDFGSATIDEHGRVTRNHEAPKIQEYIRKSEELKSAGVTQQQINDVFNHVYEFFSRYYNKGDFISKRRYGGRDKYYIPYDGEEVELYWANRDQYYVKTGEFFKKYKFEVGEYQVVFALAKAEARPSNNTGDDKYFLLHENKPIRINSREHVIEVLFERRPLNEEDLKNYGLEESSFHSTKADNVRKNTAERILESVRENKSLYDQLRRIGQGKEKTFLETHLYRYTTKQESDYFIHKDLRSFLERELDFYIKNEIFDLGEFQDLDERTMTILKSKIHAIQNISEKIIDFLAQIENFQKRLFEKKKFVVQTNYCITLDKVPEEFYEEIAKTKEQVEEWEKLYRIEEATSGTLEKYSGTNRDFLKAHKTMMIDTRFYDKDFQDRLLATFDNLDEEIDGVLVRSENFQALNLLSEKYCGKVKCIYIDPPYNTGSDDFLYKDNYQHSSWLSMMTDRLRKAKDFMTPDGVIFVNIDDNEYSHLMTLMRILFTKQSEIPTFIWRKKGTSTNVRGAQVSSLTDYIIAFGGDDSINPRVTPKEQREYPYHDEEGRYRTTIIEKKHAGLYKRDTMRFEILGQKPRPGKRWQIGRAKARDLEAKNRFVIQNGIVKLKVYEFEDHDTLSANPNILFNHGSTNTASTLLKDMFGIPEIYSNPKPVELIEKCVRLGAGDDDLIMDFFAGSGTTAHAVMKLNKEEGRNLKFILMEIADCFDPIMLARIKKAAYSFDWKNGKPSSNDGLSCFFKYHYLEQYEDTLNNIVFKASDKTIQEKLDSFEDYFVHYMLDYETKKSPTRLLLDRFETPFDYMIKTQNGEKEKTETVDLVETFNYLLGLTVDKLRTYKDGKNEYRLVIGRKDKKKVMVIWRNTKDLDLKRERAFIEEKIVSEFSPDQIYINGDSYIKNAKPIEAEFMRLMGA